MTEALVLQARIYHMRGNLPQALSTLEKALALAEPEGYIRLFVDEGLPMAELLHHALRKGITPSYIATLLEAFGMPVTQQKRGVVLPQSSLLQDPLSERELEVLRRIATGRSNQEIAQELVVGESTVKTHLKHIYSKLYVHNRTEAVARARELHLLPS